MKEYCKKHSCTINDYTTCLLSCAMHSYLTQEQQRMKDDGELIIPCPKSIRVAVPFSFRQPFKRVKDIKMNNDFGSMLVELKLFSDVNDSL